MKGVIVEIRPDHEMPIDPVTGAYVDMCMDPTSIPGRMNIGNLYEQYFCAMSRGAKKMLTDKFNSYGVDYKHLGDLQVQELFSVILGLTGLIDTEQHQGYLHATIDQQREIIKEVVEKELYLYYKVTSKKKPYQVVCDSLGTIYEPPITNVIWSKDGKSFVTKNQMMVGPQYIILLAKTPDNYLSCASAKTNHYGFPIGVGSKQRVNLPYRNSPVRILSETETRLYASFVSRRAVIELKDRANSIGTHVAIYNNILRAPVPTNIDEVVDRTVTPYGGDAAVEFVENIVNAAGIDITYTPDTNKIHPELNV